MGSVGSADELGVWAAAAVTTAAAPVPDMSSDEEEGEIKGSSVEVERSGGGTWGDIW